MTHFWLVAVRPSGSLQGGALLMVCKEADIMSEEGAAFCIFASRIGHFAHDVVHLIAT